MNRAIFYVSFLVAFVAVALISLPQKLWAKEKCMVIWTASQGELRFPDQNYGNAGLSLGREPGEEARVFMTHEVVQGNITPNTKIVVRGWEPERYREVFSLLVGKRVSVQAKIQVCGPSAESATSEILELSLVQLPSRDGATAKIVLLPK